MFHMPNAKVSKVAKWKIYSCQNTSASPDSVLISDTVMPNMPSIEGVQTGITISEDLAKVK